MNKNTKKVPALRFPQFTDDWEQRKLGELTMVCREKNKDGNRPVYSVTSSDGFIPQSEQFIDREVASQNKSNYSIVRKNQFAYNPSRINVGSIAYLKENIEVIISPLYVVFECSELLDEAFLSEFVRTMQFHNQRETQTAGSVRDSLSYEGFSEVNIAIPTIEEQHQIGSYFYNLNNLITLHQRKYEQLKTLKKGLLQKMFPKKGESVPEIRFPQFTGDWEQRKLGELGEILTGSTPSTSHKEYYSDDGILWVTPTDISENIIYDTSRKLSDKGQEIARIAPKGTILVTCIASIGKNTMLGTMGSFNQQINALIPNFEKNNPYFLLTESMLWSEKMKQQAAAGTMQIVNKTEFSELVTIVPKLEEQEAIGNYFKSIDSLITLHQRKYEQLKTLKKALLQKMFI